MKRFILALALLLPSVSASAQWPAEWEGQAALDNAWEAVTHAFAYGNVRGEHYNESWNEIAAPNIEDLYLLRNQLAYFANNEELEDGEALYEYWMDAIDDEMDIWDSFTHNYNFWMIEHYQTALALLEQAQALQNSKAGVGWSPEFGEVIDMCEDAVWYAALSEAQADFMESWVDSTDGVIAEAYAALVNYAWIGTVYVPDDPQ